ncbi:MAG TPA: tetratricopeptide repeat protein, partial [Longimicrobium sp.]|nr:tetratricopeptide repeat protein [Longimicrobium sp.]
MEGVGTGLALCLSGVLLAGCAGARPYPGPPRSPNEIAVLLTNPDHALVLDRIDDQGVPAQQHRVELLPGRHTLRLHRKPGGGSRFANTGPITLTFLAVGGHLYRLRDHGDAAQGRWVARIEDAGSDETKDNGPPPPPGELEANCRRRVANDCLRLGVLYEYGDDSVGWDDARASQAYARACSAGQPLGCNNLGQLYAAGHGVDEDARRATELFEKAC